MFRTGIVKQVEAIYRPVDENDVKYTKCNYFIDKNESLNDVVDYRNSIMLLPPRANEDTRVLVKLCLNAMKQKPGMTEYAMREDINSLTPGEFVFMILDKFQNSEMMLLAEEIISYVGCYPKIKISFERVYSDYYREVANYHNRVKVKLRTYYWRQLDDTPTIFAINNMELDTRNGNNVEKINGEPLDYYRLLNGYEKYSYYSLDLFNELNDGATDDVMACRFIRSNLKLGVDVLSYWYNQQIPELHTPLPKWLAKLRRGGTMVGADNVGIPIGIHGEERPDIDPSNINPFIHEGVLDMIIGL